MLQPAIPFHQAESLAQTYDYMYERASIIRSARFRWLTSTRLPLPLFRIKSSRPDHDGAS